MSWSEDDWGKPFFPTRFGSPQGHATERKMLDAVGGFDGIRRRTKLNADGSTTTLKTRGGMPVFITTKAKTNEITAAPMSYFLHGVEITTTSAAYLSAGNAITYDVSSVVKYPTFYGSGYVQRIDHQRDEHFEKLNFASTWTNGSESVRHSGRDNYRVEIAVTDAGIFSAGGVLNYVIPGSVGICTPWTYWTSHAGGVRTSFRSFLYADGYPNYADVSASIDKFTGARLPIVAFKRGGETFYIELNLSRCGAAIHEYGLARNAGLPTVVENTYSRIISVDGNTSSVDITFPPIPGRGFFKHTGTNGIVTTPIFQSYGAYPRWMAVNRSGTKAITATRGGFYARTTYGNADFGHAGMIGEIDLVTGAMTHLPVDTIYHRKYLTLYGGYELTYGKTLDEYAVAYEFDILRIAFDENDEQLILSQSVRIERGQFGNYKANNVFAVSVNGQSIVYRNNTNSIYGGISTLYANLEDDVYVFCVTEITSAFPSELYAEYVLVHKGVSVFKWPVNFSLYNGAAHSPVAVSSNAASASYTVGPGVTEPLSGVKSICEPYHETVASGVVGKADTEIYCADVATGSRHPGAQLTLSGAASVALSPDKKYMAVSIVPHSTDLRSVNSTPCRNVVVNLRTNEITEFGDSNSFYNRLNFLDSLP